MKAITILQPWAQLIVTGEKRIETRSWKTTHRGPLAIHAGRRFTDAHRSLATLEPFCSAIKRHQQTDLEKGCLLGIVTLDDCVPIDSIASTITPTERAFGDHRPGRWAWLISNPQRFISPILYQGTLGLFDVPDDIVALQLPDDCMQSLANANAQKTPITVNKAAPLRATKTGHKHPE